MASEAEEERVEDIMAKRVVTIGFEATVRDGASLMARRKCSCLVVLRGGAAIGIVTERDLVRKVLAEGVDPSKVMIGDVMSTPLITIVAGSTVTEAAERMSDYLIRRLVVVDEGGALVGLVTAGDIARLLARKNEYSDSALNAIARMKKGETGGPYR